MDLPYYMTLGGINQSIFDFRSPVAGCFSTKTINLREVKSKQKIPFYYYVYHPLVINAQKTTKRTLSSYKIKKGKISKRIIKTSQNIIFHFNLVLDFDLMFLSS